MNAETIDLKELYRRIRCNKYLMRRETDYIVNSLEELQRYREIGTVKEFQTKVVDKWISVTDRLPDDGDCRFYMCLVENHIEDVPMMCQFEEEVGFGFYKDIYDPVSLGFVDTEFETMEEIGYEKVMYWRQIPEPPKDRSDEE